MPVMGFLAAALATTVSGWVMVWQLWAGSRGMGAASRLDERLRARLPRIVVAALFMGLVLFGATGLLEPLLSEPGWRYPGLAALVAAGIASYFGAGAAIGAFRLSDLRSLRRRA